VAIAGDPDSLTTVPGPRALRDGFGRTQAGLARHMKVVRQRVVTIESLAAVPLVAAHDTSMRSRP
jgi:hypothetical protein